jgi:hypothetical protein
MQTQTQPLAPSATARELHQQATTWLVISLVSSVFCLGLALGLGGALFCHIAREAAQEGNTADAQSKLMWGKVLTLVGSVMGTLSTLLGLLFFRR